MDQEDVEYLIKAPGLVSAPRNEEHFAAALPEQFEEIASKLPLHICCKGGHFDRDGSVSVAEDNVKITKSTATEIHGNAILEFQEYDDAHFTSGTRHARLDFIFEWDTQILRVWCSDANTA